LEWFFYLNSFFIQTYFKINTNQKIMNKNLYVYIEE